MSTATSVDRGSESRLHLRNEPVQARSAARLTALLDAAAGVIDEIGYERLTTAMVAERAGASIGTVYRYFPDRIALLQALSARNLERVLAGVSDTVADPRHEDWDSALKAGFDRFTEAYRSEPGFRSLRVGDVLDLRPAPGPCANSVVADHLLDVLITRFGIVDGPALRLHFRAAIEVSDALATRAFAGTGKADQAFLDLAWQTVEHVIRRGMEA